MVHQSRLCSAILIEDWATNFTSCILTNNWTMFIKMHHYIHRGHIIYPKTALETRNSRLRNTGAIFYLSTWNRILTKRSSFSEGCNNVGEADQLYLYRPLNTKIAEKNKLLERHYFLPT